MKGDFSRISYNERKHYSPLLMQQGRVQLDADWNEQALIHWFNLQNLAEDLIGRHGGTGDSFNIEPRIVDDAAVPRDFTIKKGRYYIHGAMCQNNNDSPFTDQEDYFPAPEEGTIENDTTYLVYLHLWWRHITAEEDDDIREVALEGPDTATRIKSVWQVKVVDVDDADFDLDLKENYGEFVDFLEEKNIIKRSTGALQAQAKTSSETDEPCITAPANRYRGVENQLYRVEIHHSGQACNGDGNDCATFKWSRENGSVVFPIRKLGTNSVTLEHLGRDHRFGLKAGDWVEVVDDVYGLQRRAENLLKVTAVDPDSMEVMLSGMPQLGRDLSVYPLKNPLLRRWDHPGDAAHGGAVPVTQDKWLELEDGVQIQFTEPQPENADPYWYQSGDWWWIPARTVTGDVEWPHDADNAPVAQQALDYGDRYAPLALINTGASGAVTVGQDYRRVIKRLWE